MLRVHEALSAYITLQSPLTYQCNLVQFSATLLPSVRQSVSFLHVFASIHVTGSNAATPASRRERTDVPGRTAVAAPPLRKPAGEKLEGGGAGALTSPPFKEYLHVLR